MRGSLPRSPMYKLVSSKMIGGIRQTRCSCYAFDNITTHSSLSNTRCGSISRDDGRRRFSLYSPRRPSTLTSASCPSVAASHCSHHTNSLTNPLSAINLQPIRNKTTSSLTPSNQSNQGDSNGKKENAQKNIEEEPGDTNLLRHYQEITGQIYDSKPGELPSSVLNLPLSLLLKQWRSEINSLSTPSTKIVWKFDQVHKLLTRLLEEIQYIQDHEASHQNKHFSILNINQDCIDLIIECWRITHDQIHINNNVTSTDASDHQTNAEIDQVQVQNLKSQVVEIFDTLNSILVILYALLRLPMET